MKYSLREFPDVDIGLLTHSPKTSGIRSKTPSLPIENRFFSQHRPYYQLYSFITFGNCSLPVDFQTNFRLSDLRNITCICQWKFRSNGSWHLRTSQIQNCCRLRLFFFESLEECYSSCERQFPVLRISREHFISVSYGPATTSIWTAPIHAE